MPNQWLENFGLLSLKQFWCDLATHLAQNTGGTALCPFVTGRTRMSGGVGRAVSDGGPYPISVKL